MYHHQQSQSREEFTDSPKYLKRKVKSGHVSLDYDKCDLVVTYDVEATVVGDTGRALQTESKTHNMFLNVRVDKYTDCRAYAEQLVQDSGLIPNSKVGHVENLLLDLKDYILDRRHRADSVKKVKKDLEKQKKEERRRQKREEKRRKEEEKAKEEMGNASMDDVEEYLDKLYDEDVNSKILATSMLLQLAREAGNLEDLLDNEALMGALGRTLKEDFKKSTELTVNIMNIFSTFSTFSQFHHVLHGYQVGASSMQIVKWELDRYQARLEEMTMLERVAEAQANGETPAHDPRKAKRQGEPVDMDRETLKTRSLQKKQDKVLIACLHVLLNLAEDEKVEKKMAKRSLVGDLVRILSSRSSNNTELLILTTTFIKKLAVTVENKNELVDSDIVEHLAKFVPCSNTTLMKIVLSGLFNLSFDGAIREQMVKHGFIPKLVELLQDKQFRGISIRLLYHLSMDDRCKSMFTYTDLIPYMMRMMIEFPSNHVAKELAALAINLSIHPRNCAMICQGSNFKNLIERTMKRQDPLLIKVIRNISKWTLSMQEELPDETTPEKENRDNAIAPAKTRGSTKELEIAALEAEAAANLKKQGQQYKYKRLWEPFVQDIVIMMKTSDPAIMVEAMGILANLTPGDLPKGTSFADLILENDLVEFFHKYLLPGFAEDDILLELIMVLGQFCLDQSAARLLGNSPLVKLVYDLLHEKRDDSEIVLQTLFTFYRLLRHKDSGHSLLYETQMPKDVCDLLEHPNGVVRVMADNLLDLIIDHDEANEHAMDVSRRVARKAMRESKRKPSREQKGRHRMEDSDMDDTEDDDEDEDDNDLAQDKLPNGPGFSELRGNLSKMIRTRRFEMQNREWLDIMAQEDLDDLEDHDPGFSPGSYDNNQRMMMGSDMSEDDFLHDDDDDSTEY